MNLCTTGCTQLPPKYPGFLEGVLRMSIAPIEEDALTLVESIYLGELSPWREHVKKSIKDYTFFILKLSLLAILAYMYLNKIEINKYHYAIELIF